MAGAALPWSSVLVLPGRRSTSDVSCRVFFANRIVMTAGPASSGDNVQITWQAQQFVTFAAN